MGLDRVWMTEEIYVRFDILGNARFPMGCDLSDDAFFAYFETVAF